MIDGNNCFKDFKIRFNIRLNVSLRYKPETLPSRYFDVTLTLILVDFT